MNIKYESLKFKFKELKTLIESVCDEGQQKDFALKRLKDSLLWTINSLALTEEKELAEDNGFPIYLMLIRDYLGITPTLEKMNKLYEQIYEKKEEKEASTPVGGSLTFKRCSDGKIVPYGACDEELYPAEFPPYSNFPINLGLGVINNDDRHPKLRRFYAAKGNIPATQKDFSGGKLDFADPIYSNITTTHGWFLSGIVQWPAIFRSGEYDFTSKKEALAIGIEGWALREGGHDDPGYFGRAMMLIGDYLGITPTLENMNKLYEQIYERSD